MIKRLVCRNFRSLEEVEIEFAPFTALVGPNGSGKSSILTSIDLVLGQRWPNINSLRFPHDFTRADDTKELVVRMRLTEPLIYADKLSNEHEIHGFEVSCRPYRRRTGRSERGDPNFDYRPLDNAGETPQNVALAMGKGGPSFGPLVSVPSDLRADARTLFIDHRRSLAQHQPWARGSILARLLGGARKELASVEFANGESHAEVFSKRYQTAMDALRTPRVQDIERLISSTTRRTLGFLGSATLKDLDVVFGFADPANPFGTLRLMYQETGLELPADELGSGVQSAIVVGIFEAFRELGESIGTVLIEEPEMYLHPQAQRYFYRLLVDLVERRQAQVIFSTHSPVFADLARFEALRLVRREPGEMTTIAAITDADDIAYLNDRRDREKLHAFTAARSELLFARRVLLVEGAGDVLAIKLAAEHENVDLDAEDYAVIECGSKGSIPFFARVCSALSIPVAVLHDEDIHEIPEDPNRVKRIKTENAEAERLNEEIAGAVTDKSRLIVIRPSLEEALGISRIAPDKPRRLVDALKGRDPDDWPAPLFDALRALSR